MTQHDRDILRKCLLGLDAIDEALTLVGQHTTPAESKSLGKALLALDRAVAALLELAPEER